VALISASRGDALAPSRVRDAANYLLMSLASTEERRLATEAIELLRGKRDEASSTQTTASKPKRK